MKTILDWMRGWRLHYIALASALAIGVGYSVVYFWPVSDVYEFEPERDINPILSLFKKDLFWLAADQDYDALFTLKNRSWDRNPAHFGKLQIKTAWKDGAFVGFSAYHMDKPLVGRLLFLAVDSDFRGKGYGEKLARYAINDLKKMGAKKVTLATRVSNERARKLYERLGFKQTHQDDYDFVFYEYLF